MVISGQRYALFSVPTMGLACITRCPCHVQVKTLGYWGGTSFLFSFFKWFFAANSDSVTCGFGAFPSLGIDALAYNWNFDFSLTYIGVGAFLHGPAEHQYYSFALKTLMTVMWCLALL